jgi:hypothetical protein
MTRLFPVLTIASLAVAALAGPVSPARAQGPYDGMWVVDAPPIGGGPYGGAHCQGVRLPFEIRDNQIIGSWEYVQNAPGIPTVEAGNDRDAAPVTGRVDPDGSITAQWMSFPLTGKVAGKQLEMSWSGECGPRVAKGAQDADLAALLTSGERLARLPLHQSAER